MWISCLLIRVIRGIQILVVLLPQKAGKRFLSHFALWPALKPSWRLKLQLSLICSCTKLVKLLVLSTQIYIHCESWECLQLTSLTFMACMVETHRWWSSAPQMGPQERWPFSPRSPESPGGVVCLLLSNSTHVTCWRLTPLLQGQKDVFHIGCQFPWNVCVEAGLGFSLRRRSGGGRTDWLGPLS